jgi:hypothetical protein
MKSDQAEMFDTPKPPSWRDLIPPHPAAACLPPIDDAIQRQMVDDIKKNGLRHPVIVWEAVGEDGNLIQPQQLFVLEGCSRLDAIEKIRGEQLRIDPDTGFFAGVFFENLSTTVCDPWGYVLSVNLVRRYVSAIEYARVTALAGC